MTNPLNIWIGILLAISMAANVGGGVLLRGAWKDVAAAEQREKDIGAAAQACSAGVTKLAEAGDTNRKKILEAIAASAASVKKYQGAALAAQGARPDDPNDLCGSADRYLKKQIQGGIK